MFEFSETETKILLTQINFVHELPQYEQHLHIYLDKTPKPTTMILRTYLPIRQQQQQVNRLAQLLDHFQNLLCQKVHAKSKICSKVVEFGKF